MKGDSVSASALKRSKASTPYWRAVLPMSPRLASRMTGMPGYSAWMCAIRPASTSSAPWAAK